MKFLVIQTAFPGDVILATAVVEKLRKFYPEARIDFLLRKGNESLLQGHPYINKVHPWDKRHKFISAFSIIRCIRREKYDHVFNLQRFFTSGLMTVLSGARHKTGFSKNPLSLFYQQSVPHHHQRGIHETDRNLALVQPLTDGSRTPPRLYPADDDRAFISRYRERPYVCMAPASVWFTKRLPAHKWVSMIRGILAGIPVYLIGGPGDAPLAEEIRNKAGHADVVNLCGKLSWLQTAALMEGARMNYVNDSAPLHVASAMNAPVTAFFCSTIPDFGFGPLSGKSVVIQTKENLRCRPCGLHGRNACPEGHFRCAESIEISGSASQPGGRQAKKNP